VGVHKEREMSKIVTIFNNNGTTSEYEALSSRWPKFLTAFPVQDGFSVTVKATEYTSFRESTLELTKLALEKGIKPIDLGIPEMGNGVVFEATLRKGGEVLASASALKSIQSYKDWEIGETAARQRLAAACGFGGDVFDRDEKDDMSAQDIKTSEQHKKSEETPIEDIVVKPIDTQAQAQAKQVQDNKPVPAAILRQIEHQATLKQVEVPVVSNMQEAQEALKSLLAA